MSNPFAIQPSGTVIQGQGTGGAIAEGLAGVLAAMKQREELKRQQQEFQSKQAYYASLQEGSALDNEKKRADLKAKQNELKAKEGGLGAFSQWVGSGAKFENAGSIVAKIKDPDVAQDFLNRVKDHLVAQNESAVAQTNQAQAQLAQATTGEEISTKKSQAKTAANQAVITGAEAQGAGAQNAARTALMKAQAAKAIADAQNPGLEDPSTRINSALNMWKTGTVTLGAAFKSVGAPLPDGMDPNAKFDPTVAGQSRGMAIYKNQAKQAASAVLQANTELDALIKAGTKMTAKSTAFEKVPFGAARGLIPEDQQQMTAAAMSVLSNYALAVSGKAVTEQEARRLSTTIVPLAGDKPGNIQRKLVRREAMTQIMFDASQGGGRPLSQIFKDVIGALRTKGVDKENLDLLEADRQKAFRLEQDYLRKAANGDDSVLPVTAGLEPSTPDSVDNLLNGVGR